MFVSTPLVECSYDSSITCNEVNDVSRTADLIAEAHCVEINPLEFEKYSIEDDHYKGFESQYPLEEINLGTHDDVRITYVCKNLVDPFRTELFDLLHEFKDCFTWDYHEMPGLDHSLVEHRLALKPNARHVKQTPRRFAPEINVKIKEEMERLIKAKFIRTDRYVEWVSNIVPVMKKNGKLRVCIDFRDLNNATSKDEYFMTIADMLIDSAAENEILSFMDGYFRYNQIFIAEYDVAKTAFRSPGALGFVVHKKGIAIDKNKVDAILSLSAPKSKKEVQSFLGKINYLRRFISNLSDRTRVFAPLIKLKNGSKFEWTIEHQLAFDSIKTYLSKVPIMVNVRLFEPLKLYIAASEDTIWCMLAQDSENGYERAVYYLSRVLTDIKMRYFLIEKLCLSLYHACMKLKCYMVAKSVKVIAQTDVIKYILSFPMLRGRLGKWMLALTEFDLQYVPVKTVKGQVIANFLVDNSKDLNDQGANIVDVEHKDGAGVGILIISPEGIPSEFLFELKYPFSNNVAEYEALILGLEILIDKGALEVQILGDSQLVLKQLSKEFKCNNETLQKYLVTAWELLMSFRKVSLVHIPRIHNEIANELAQIASRYRISPETIKKLSSIHQILLPANEREVICMNEWEDSDWRKTIAQYLKDPNTTKMRWVLYRNHVYWPSMIKDCIDYAKACQECQKHGSIQQILATELHSIIKPWPFRVEKNIIHRFGIPQTLSTDQGTMFTGQRIKNFAASRNINMVTSIPYYAQANGQVEAAHKILIGLIKKHIGNRPRTWHEILSQVLWAYRNSPRVYGHDAVLQLEINLNTLRVSKQNDFPVDDYWNAMFDELNELDSERILALENIGELVLKVVLPMEKKSIFLGKWSHSWEGPFQVIDIESGKVINSINGKYLKLFYCWQA
ncbi:hypothetical protein AAHE18_07G151100 [Arachis hypogaea]